MPTGDGYYMWLSNDTGMERPLDANYYAAFRCYKCGRIEHRLTPANEPS